MQCRVEQGSVLQCSAVLWVVVHRLAGPHPASALLHVQCVLTPEQSPLLLPLLQLLGQLCFLGCPDVQEGCVPVPSHPVAPQRVGVLGQALSYHPGLQ